MARLTPILLGLTFVMSVAGCIGVLMALAGTSAQLKKWQQLHLVVVDSSCRGHCRDSVLQFLKGE